MPPVPDGIAAWAAKSGPAAVLAAVRIRARRSQHTESGTLTKLLLSPEQRRELGLLLSTKWAISGQPVKLENLAASLAEHNLSVRGLVESLDGTPIVENRTLRSQAEAETQQERAQVVAMLTAEGVDHLVADLWLADPGLPRAGDGALTELATTVVAVWRQLPSPGTHIRLATLAAGVLHNAHALDADQPAGRAVARLAAAAHGLERPQRGGPSWRQAWAAVGVLCDGVSSRVLTLNLSLADNSSAGRLCAGNAGEPVWLTLRSLPGVTAAGATTVFVCENPTVVEAAADALGTTCPPMVCTDGIASAAATDLISAMSAAGCAILARADVDAAGFTIVEQVRAVAPTARPWRFDAATYLDGIGLDSAEPRLDEPREVIDHLRAVFDAYRTPLHEERLLDVLLDDLALHAAKR